MILCIYSGIGHTSDKLLLEYGIEQIEFIQNLPYLVNTSIISKQKEESAPSAILLNKFEVKYDLFKDWYVGLGVLLPRDQYEYRETDLFQYSELDSNGNVKYNYNRRYIRTISPRFNVWRLSFLKYLDENKIAFFHAGISYLNMSVAVRTEKTIENTTTNTTQQIYDRNEDYDVSGASYFIGSGIKISVYKGIYVSGALRLTRSMENKDIEIDAYKGLYLIDVNNGSDLERKTASLIGGSSNVFTFGANIGYQF
ncbi:MAG: hypothetical protein LHV68_05325 [Elusimicrobia bacterium]|nr:hypothetical protein [Candidatus Liberimonas magnetica]